MQHGTVPARELCFIHEQCIREQCIDSTMSLLHNPAIPVRPMLASPTSVGACSQHAGRASSPPSSAATQDSSVWPFLAEKRGPADSCEEVTASPLKFKLQTSLRFDWCGLPGTVMTLCSYLCTHFLGYHSSLVCATSVDDKNFGPPMVVCFFPKSTALQHSLLPNVQNCNCVKQVCSACLATAFAMLCSSFCSRARIVDGGLSQLADG